MGNNAAPVGGVGKSAGAQSANWVPQDQWDKMVKTAEKGMSPDEKMQFEAALNKLLESKQQSPSAPASSAPSAAPSAPSSAPPSPSAPSTNDQMTPEEIAALIKQAMADAKAGTDSSGNAGGNTNAGQSAQQAPQPVMAGAAA
jgi:hypothetical protein